MTPIDIKTLFEDLQRRIDTPEEYNSLISRLFAQITTNAISLQWFDGTPYVNDPLRAKTLSLTRQTISAGHYGPNQSSRYLKMEGVVAVGNGFVLPRKATITALWAKSRNSQPWQLQVRKNDDETVLTTLNVNGQNTADQLDIDLEQGDFVQLYMEGEGVDHPLAFVELAWRQETI